MVFGSTFHTRARSATCSSFCQLRNPGRSPLAPHSRVFWAVGCPFICRTPAPGRPSMPRIRCRLLTCTAAAVAWWDWWTPCSTVDSSRSAVPRISAASRIRAAGTSQTPSAHSGVQGATRAFSSSKPTVWAAMYAVSTRPARTTSCKAR